MKGVDLQDMDNLLTRMENLCYACEHKAKWPSASYLKGINAQIERDLKEIKRLQKKYPRKKC